RRRRAGRRRRRERRRAAGGRRARPAAAPLPARTHRRSPPRGRGRRSRQGRGGPPELTDTRGSGGEGSPPPLSPSARGLLPASTLSVGARSPPRLQGSRAEQKEPPRGDRFSSERRLFFYVFQVRGRTTPVTPP